MTLNSNTPVDETEPSHAVVCRGQHFQVIRHAVVAAALHEFASPFEAGTLQFFDAVLPSCDKMIDVGAYVGLMGLYAASRVADVYAFEASPTNFALLRRNVAVNNALQDRIRLFPYGLGDCDEQVALYGKAFADSGSSIFRTVERDQLVDGAPEAIIQLRDADVALRQVGLNPQTLLKIDIEGAEYLVVPALAALLSKSQPFLHLSFHPFNLVAGEDEYLNTVVRIRRALQVAEALSSYRYMYFYEQQQGTWWLIEPSERMLLLRKYLLQPKPVPRVATAQYGFVNAVGFSNVALPGLG